MELRALKDRADGLFAKGRFEQCAELYREIIQLEPRDPRLYVRHGEACRRTGHSETAARSYRAAASLLAGSGHFSRAQAALSVASELAPGDLDIKQVAARLEAQAGFRAEAGSSGSRPAQPPSYRPAEIELDVTDDEPVQIERNSACPTEEGPEPSITAMRRLSDQEIAVRTQTGQWVVLFSSGPIRARRANPTPLPSERPPA